MPFAARTEPRPPNVRGCGILPRGEGKNGSREVRKVREVFLTVENPVLPACPVRKRRRGGGRLFCGTQGLAGGGGWSTTRGVVEVLPSRWMVVVQWNLAGKPAGSV